MNVNRRTEGYSY